MLAVASRCPRAGLTRGGERGGLRFSPLQPPRAPIRTTRPGGPCSRGSLPCAPARVLSCASGRSAHTTGWPLLARVTSLLHPLESSRVRAAGAPTRPGGPCSRGSLPCCTRSSPLVCERPERPHDRVALARAGHFPVAPAQVLSRASGRSAHTTGWPLLARVISLCTRSSPLVCERPERPHDRVALARAGHFPVHPLESSRVRAAGAPTTGSNCPAPRDTTGAHASGLARSAATRGCARASELTPASATRARPPGARVWRRGARG